MDKVKERVGRQAADYVEDGMVVGLGTGSTAYWFVDELGKRLEAGTLKDIVGVTTSRRTTHQANQLGIPLKDIDDIARVDVVVDGADECNMDFNGIKGGGGALLQEKIVAQYSNKVVWVVDESKMVKELGAFPLPVEIVPFGSWRLFHEFKKANLNPSFRKSGDDSLYVTDSGNYIIDLDLQLIHQPEAFSHHLKSIVGVVEHGLFMNYADTILVGHADGTIRTYEKNP